jgi:hypothetical protein
MLQAVKNNDSGGQQKSVNPKTPNTPDPLDDSDINDSDLEDSISDDRQGISPLEFQPPNNLRRKTYYQKIHWPQIWANPRLSIWNNQTGHSAATLPRRWSEFCGQFPQRTKFWFRDNARSPAATFTR